MKRLAGGKGRALVSALAASCVGVALVVSASSGTASATIKHVATRKGSTKPFVVGFTNPTAAVEVLDTIGKAITARGKRLGVKVVELDDQLTVSKQVSDIKTLIGEHVNGIITFPLSTTAVLPAVASARKAGIDVVGLGTLKGTELKYKPSSTAFNAVVTQGAVQGGKVEGRAFAKAMGGKGNFVAINIAAPVPGVRFQLQQVINNVLKGHPKLHLLGEEYNTTTNETGGIKAMDEAIARWGSKIDGVIGYNDYSAEGAGIAAKTSHLKLKDVMGRNGDPTAVTAIKSGEITGLNTIQPWKEGATAMNLMYRLLKGTKHVPAIATVHDVIYTKGNIKKRISWTAAVQKIASGKIKGQDASSGH
ncbi:MAG: sugar ABC transporter substrate-binding protein [Actinomycetota bacterium]|nr:sugar ABC transporter substrate-binding protein [Actinomycetota bacterium]